MAAATSAYGATSEQDRLGALPDSILLAILSLVPTLDAVRASVLSRRWRYLWTSVPVLDFDDRSHKFFLLERPNCRGTVAKENRKSRFVEFVDKVLTFHHTPALHRFRLSLSCSGYADRAVEDWVRVAVTREVRELDLRLGSSRTTLPSRLFVTCSLVDLKLDLWGSQLKLPAAMALAGLRSMHLRNVSFRDGHLTGELFSSCAALRSLAMVDCAYHRLSRLEILAPLLQRLTIDGPSGKDMLRDSQVKICAPQLTFFKYRASLPQSFDVGLLSSLVDAELEFHGLDEDDHGSDDSDEDEYPRQDRGLCLGRVQDLLHQLSCAKNLKICHVCVEALSKIPAGSPTRPPHVVFGGLNRLQMHSDRLDYATLCLILRFLVANPALKALALEFVGSTCAFLSDSDGKEEYLDILGVYSQQTSGVLEEIDVRCMHCSEAVLDLVKILLQNQACLEMLLLNTHLCYATNYSSDSDQKYCSSRRKQLMKKVSSFPRRSRNLVIAFL